MSSWIAASWRASPLLSSFLWQPQEAGSRVSTCCCNTEFNAFAPYKNIYLSLLLFKLYWVYILFLFWTILSFSRVPFWRFLITGADQNQELKMWCTVSWTCLQTIRCFIPSYTVWRKSIFSSQNKICVDFSSCNFLPLVFMIVFPFYFRFSPDLFNSSVLPSLKASLDLSAEYLILTDVQRKVSTMSMMIIFYYISFMSSFTLKF